jgi:DHA1 family multidrug resistance protein-like MFS transporter
VNRRLLTVLGAGSFVLGVGGSMVFTLLAELQDERGLPTSSLGLVAGSFFVAALVGQLGLARHADRGRAKLLLVGALLASTGSLVWFAYGNGLAQMVAARVLGGLAFGVWDPIVKGLAGRADRERAGATVGLLTSAQLAGVVVGPLVGGVLADAGSLDAAFALVAVAVVAVVPFVLFASVPETEAAVVAPGRVRRLVRRRPVVVAALLGVALFAPEGVYDALWARYLTDLGVSTTFIGVSLAIYAAPFMLLAPFGGRLADRFGPDRAALVAAAATTPLLLLYGVVREPWVLVVLGVGEAAMTAVGFPAVAAAVARAAPDEDQVAAQGFVGGVSLAVAGFAGALAAPAYAAGGARPVFVVSAVVVAAVAAAAGLLLARRSGSPGAVAAVATPR